MHVELLDGHSTKAVCAGAAACEALSGSGRLGSMLAVAPVLFAHDVATVARNSR
jgi:hypothetical protein